MLENSERLTDASAVGDAVELQARGDLDAAMKAWCGTGEINGDVFSKVLGKTQRGTSQVELQCHEAFRCYTHTFKVEEIMTERPNTYRVCLVEKGEESFERGPVGDDWTELFQRRAAPLASAGRSTAAPVASAASAARLTDASAVGDAVELQARGDLGAALKAWCGTGEINGDVFSKVFGKVQRGTSQVELQCHEAFRFYTHIFKVEEIMTERPNTYRICLVEKGEESFSPGPVGDDWTQLFPMQTRESSPQRRAPAARQESVFEGWLKKRGPTVDFSWERRWCVLTVTSLSIYTNDRYHEKKADVDLFPVTRAVPFKKSNAPGESAKHKGDRPHGFVLDPDPSAGKSRRLFYFEAEDSGSLDGWVSTIEETAKKTSSPVPTSSGTLRVIVEIGDDGRLQQDTDMRMEDAREIILILDPRTVSNIMKAGLREKFASLKDRTTVFLLLPSQTSSPESLLFVEILLQFLSCVWQVHGSYYWEGDSTPKRVRVVRMDDWFHLREKILPQMLEGDYFLYPREERQSMLGLLSQFEPKLWMYRAWCHWVIGEGVEEGEIQEVLESLLRPLLANGNALACIEPSPPGVSSGKAVLGTARRPVFVAFSEDAATRYRGDFGAISVPSGEIDGNSPVPDALRSDDVYPIFLVESADLGFTPGQYGSRAMPVCSRYREFRPSDAITVIFLYEDFESLVSDRWLVLALDRCLENCDVVVFATRGEAPAVGSFFTKARHGSENIARAACMSLTPFPRLMFFTMSTCMGQDLENGSILFPALTVGPPSGSGIPAEKFLTRFMLSDADGKPLTDRVLPSQDGSSATIISSPKIVMKLVSTLLKRTFGSTCEKALGDGCECELRTADWATIFGEEFRGVSDDGDIDWAKSNLQDLVTEYRQYSEEQTEGNDVE